MGQHVLGCVIINKNYFSINNLIRYQVLFMFVSFCVDYLFLVYWIKYMCEEIHSLATLKPED